MTNTTGTIGTVHALCTDLVLAGLVHPRQNATQHPLRIGVFLKGHLVPRLSGSHVELPLAVQRLALSTVATYSVAYTRVSVGVSVGVGFGASASVGVSVSVDVSVGGAFYGRGTVALSG